MEPSMVEKMVNAQESTGAAIVLCGFRLFNDDKSEISHKAWGYEKHNINGVSAIEGMYTGKIPVTVWAKIFRRDTIVNLKISDRNDL